MQELRKHKIIHRDLKPQNILIAYSKDSSSSSSVITLKIADFGVARYLGENKVAHTMIGTVLYMAPEVMRGKPYVEKSDVFSIGVIVYECLMAKRPYAGNDQFALAKTYRQPVCSIPFPTETSKEFDKFVTKLLEREPSKRMSFEEFMTHLGGNKTP